MYWETPFITVGMLSKITGNWDVAYILIPVRSYPMMFVHVNPCATGGYFGHFKSMQQTLKLTETLAFGYSSESTRQELFNKHQHARV